MFPDFGSDVLDIRKSFCVNLADRLADMSRRPSMERLTQLLATFPAALVIQNQPSPRNLFSKALIHHQWHLTVHLLDRYRPLHGAVWKASNTWGTLLIGDATVEAVYMPTATNTNERCHLTKCYRNEEILWLNPVKEAVILPDCSSDCWWRACAWQN